MTRYLLDTNILSNATKPFPSPAIADWLAAQSDKDLFVSTLTLAEVERGILEKQAGKRRRALQAWFEGPKGLRTIFGGRILPFDERAASAWARLMAAGTKSGRPRSAFDMIIAAIAEANDCIIVTQNIRDFTGLNAFNPDRG